MFHVMQRRDTTPYPLKTGKRFLLSQIPPDVKMLVSAHSSSPIFAEQTVAKADKLLAAKAIDLPSYVELVDPPQMETLRAKAVILQENQAKMAQEMFKLKQEQILRGRSRAR
jgi:hypothetical protein